MSNKANLHLKRRHENCLEKSNTRKGEDKVCTGHDRGTCFTYHTKGREAARTKREGAQHHYCFLFLCLDPIYKFFFFSHCSDNT